MSKYLLNQRTKIKTELILYGAFCIPTIANKIFTLSVQVKLFITHPLVFPIRLISN